MKRFTIYSLMVLLTGIWMQVQSQETLSETFIINGGDYSNSNEHVSVSRYNHAEEEYNLVDSIYTQSTQDALVNSNNLYVCAQDSLVYYDLESMSRVAGVELSGLNQLAVYEDKLLVSRQYPATTQSFKILNKYTLEELETIELSGEAAGIRVFMDSAYVAVPGAWGTEEGRLAVIDLTGMELSREINFGADAQGLKELFLKGNAIYTVNTNFSNATENHFSVSRFDVLSEEIETTIISGDYYGYYGNSEMVDDKIYIPVSSSIASYDINTDETDFDFIDVVPAAMQYDAVNERLHITTSDYSTYGEYSVYSLEGEQVQGPESVGVSPEAMAHYYDTDNAFAFDDVEFWIGEGDKEAMLVIDWNDGVNPVSIAWGYRFDGELTAEEMMENISETDAFLDITLAGGFLNDITYEGDLVSHSGIGGDPDYWSTWSRTDGEVWQMNSGISETISDQEHFGCSYGFNPTATAPDAPVAAPESVTRIAKKPGFQPEINQTNGQLIIKSPVSLKNITLYDITGRRILFRKAGSAHYSLSKKTIRNNIVIMSVSAENSRRWTEKLILK